MSMFLASSSIKLSVAIISALSVSIVYAGGTKDMYYNTDLYNGMGIDFSVQNTTTDGANIIDGQYAPFGKYPSFAVADGDGVCGATLIWPDVLMTAAHCESAFAPYNDKAGRPTSAYIGGTSLNNAPESIGIKGTVRHPLYDDLYLRNDILLVFLDEASEAPVSVWNTNPRVPAVGQNVTVIGHGKTSDTSRVSMELKEARVNIVDFDVCNAAYDNVFNSEATFCASGNTGFHCNGDSGGPLFADDDGTTVVVGVVSFTARSSCKDLYLGYTRVSTYSDWIFDNLCLYSNVRPRNEETCCRRSNCKFLGLFSGHFMFKEEGPNGRCRSRCHTNPTRMIQKGWKCGLCNPWE